MFDLSTQPELPKYEVKLRDGSVKSYDTLNLSFELRQFEGETEPAKVRELVNRFFGVDVTAADAMLILNDFLEFAEKHIETSLKKVIGRVPSFDITTGSRPLNAKS